jgi:hypothetical protein
MATPRLGADRSEIDVPGLVRLDAAACWRFLGRHDLGRVAVVRFERPVVYPVNYALDGRSVVFRTAPGSKLLAASNAQPAVFEVDEADELFKTGTSVMVHGQIVEVADPDERDRLRQLPIRPWAPGPRDHFVRVEPEWISGRQIVVPDVADALGVDGG